MPANWRPLLIHRRGRGFLRNYSTERGLILTFLVTSRNKVSFGFINTNEPDTQCRFKVSIETSRKCLVPLRIIDTLAWPTISLIASLIAGRLLLLSFLLLVRLDSSIVLLRLSGIGPTIRDYLPCKCTCIHERIIHDTRKKRDSLIKS